MSMSHESARNWIERLHQKHLNKKSNRLQQVGITRIASFLNPIEIKEIDKLFHDGDLENYTTRIMISKFRWIAYICYVYGFYEGSIVMSGASLEALLKYELTKREIDTSTKKFSELNDLALDSNIISKDEYGYINKVRKARNRLLHFKFPKERKFTAREYAADFLSGDAFSNWTSPSAEKRIRNRTEDVLNNMQKVFDYFNTLS